MVPAWLTITAGILRLALSGGMAVLVGIALAIPDLLWLSGILALARGVRQGKPVSLSIARVVLPLTLLLDVFIVFVVANLGLNALYLADTSAGTFIDLLILLGGLLLQIRFWHYWTTR